MQHETGPLAIECHERCARFHILGLHFERDRRGFSIPLEEQQLMNSEDSSVIVLGHGVSNPEQLCKVSKSFTKINVVATSRQMNSRCAYIIVSFISATNANGMKISHLPSSLTQFSSLPPSFANTYRPNRHR
jgi:hypothetical protein